MKNKIRQDILKIRKKLSSKTIDDKSNFIYHHLKKLSLYENAQNIMVYIDFRNEVRTNQIIDDLLSSNKNVIIPISVPKTKEMILSKVLDPKKELIEGTYGILEPKEEYIRKIDSSIIDLILVPGVAFDSKGHRIGYGGGYYDRFLDTLKKHIPTVALAFDLQIIERVPYDPFDKKMDYIITETKIITSI